MIYAVYILLFLLFWAFISGLFLTLFDKSKPVDKLKYFDEDHNANENHESRKKSGAGILKLLSTLIPRSRLSKKKEKKLETELMKADLPITVEELLVIKILSSSAIGFLSFALFKDYFITALIFAGIWSIPRAVISRKIKERIKLFDSQLSEGINIISNSLKAGYSFMQAVAEVSRETADPFSREFKKLLKEIALGITEEDALKNLLSRMESEDLKLVVNAILIQKDIGGSLSEILDNISDTIRDRQRIKGELKTLTAQGRLSGAIIMLIPVFLGMFMYIFNKEYIILLFTTTIGLIMVFAAVISEILGFFIIRKIVNIEM